MGQHRTSPWFDIRHDEDGNPYMAVSVRGIALLRLVLTNKGTAFTQEERELLGLDGILPPAVKTIEQQAERAYAGYVDMTTDIGRYQYLRGPDDETLVWMARGNAVRAGSPNAMLSELMADAAGLTEGSPAAERQRTLHSWLTDILSGEPLHHASLFLAELVGAPHDDAREPELRTARADPVLMADRIRWALADVIDALCDRHTVAMVLEDLLNRTANMSLAYVMLTGRAGRGPAAGGSTPRGAGRRGSGAAAPAGGHLRPPGHSAMPSRPRVRAKARWHRTCASIAAALASSARPMRTPFAIGSTDATWPSRGHNERVDAGNAPHSSSSKRRGHRALADRRVRGGLPGHRGRLRAARAQGGAAGDRRVWRRVPGVRPARARPHPRDRLAPAPEEEDLVSVTTITLVSGFILLAVLAAAGLLARRNAAARDRGRR